jgi:hypothetical protein
MARRLSELLVERRRVSVEKDTGSGGVGLKEEKEIR